jgi:hypothetical protein
MKAERGRERARGGVDRVEKMRRTSGELMRLHTEKLWSCEEKTAKSAGGETRSFMLEESKIGVCRSIG